MSGNHFPVLTQRSCPLGIHPTAASASSHAAELAVNLSVVGLDKFAGGTSALSPLVPLAIASAAPASGIH